MNRISLSLTIFGLVSSLVLIGTALLSVPRMTALAIYGLSGLGVLSIHLVMGVVWQIRRIEFLESHICSLPPIKGGFQQ